MAEKELWAKYDPNYQKDCHDIFISLKEKMNIDCPIVTVWYTLKSHNRKVPESIKAEVYPKDIKVVFHLNHIYEKEETLEKNRINFVWTALHELIHFKRGFDSVDNEYKEAFNVRFSRAAELDIDYQTLFKIKGWNETSNYLTEITGAYKLMWDIFIYKKMFNIISRYYDLGFYIKGHKEEKKILINDDMMLSIKRVFDKLDPSMNLLLSGVDGFGWHDQFRRD